MPKYCKSFEETVKVLKYITSDIDTIIDTRGDTDVKAKYPCDTEPFECPFNARYSEDCRYYCGLGVDEDEPEE